MPSRVLLLAILLVAWPAVSRADTLDDASIRAMYKQQADAASDSDKTLELMQAQMADEFVLHQKVAFDFGNGQIHNSEQTLNKAQVIDATRSGAQSEKIEKFDNAIASIKYSTDKKYAYVDDTTTAVKTVNMPGPGGQTMEVHATQGQACLDTLMLIGGSIKLVKSQCYQKVMVAK